MIFIRSYFAKEGSLFSATKIKLTEKDKIIQSDYKAIEALNDFSKSPVSTINKSGNLCFINDDIPSSIKRVIAKY